MLLIFQMGKSRIRPIFSPFPSSSTTKLPITDSQTKLFGRNPFMVPFYNFHFYLFLVPFKIAYDSDKNEYTLKKYLCQRLTCFVVHLVAFSYLFLTAIMSGAELVGLSRKKGEDGSREGKTIASVFDFVSNSNSLFLLALSINTMWRKPEQVLEVVERTKITEITRTAKREIFLVY